MRLENKEEKLNYKFCLEIINILNVQFSNPIVYKKIIHKTFSYKIPKISLIVYKIISLFVELRSLISELHLSSHQINPPLSKDNITGNGLCHSRQIEDALTANALYAASE